MLPDTSSLRTRQRTSRNVLKQRKDHKLRAKLHVPFLFVETFKGKLWRNQLPKLLVHPPLALPPIPVPDAAAHQALLAAAYKISSSRVSYRGRSHHHRYCHHTTQRVPPRRCATLCILPISPGACNPGHYCRIDLPIVVELPRHVIVPVRCK
jgi:hypothetical protein